MNKIVGEGTKHELQGLLNIWKVHGDSCPALIIKKLNDIIQVIEDAYSVANPTELQEAIDAIGDQGGTIFIESGTHIVSTTIDIDGCGSYVIYGHGSNTILQPAAGVTVFNVTCAQSVIFKTFRIDCDNYNLLAPNTKAVIVNEGSNNVVAFSDVSIDGDGSNGIAIDLQSNNCIVEHCNIADMKIGIKVNNSDSHTIVNNPISSCDDYGIWVDTGNYCNISHNICTSNENYGIYLDTVTYSTIAGNICNSNEETGIYITDCTYLTISSNTCGLNEENGIYLTECSHNTISSNTCSDNDSNSITAKAGLYITSNSDYNTITANSVNNNNNAGIGTGYGIYIGAPTCDENVVSGNNVNGNDIDYKDVGTLTLIIYHVQSTDEIQDAIDSIGTGSGTVVITSGSITLTSTIDIDGGGDYIIEGGGDVSELILDGNFEAFYITSARSCTIRRMKIDASSLTSLLKEIINIDEASNNKIICDNLIITGDGTHGLGISLSSDNCRVTNCTFENIKAGVFTSNSANNIITENICQNNDNGINNYFGSDCIITGNVCSYNTIGIFNDRSTNSTIVENTCNHNERYGIYNYGSSDCTITGNACNGNNISDVSDGAGIQLTDNSDYNTVAGNSCNNNANTGAGTAYGININTVDCDNNIIGINSTQNNDTDYVDNGTGTVLHGDDTVYGVLWDDDLGTATKNVIYDKIESIGGAVISDIAYAISWDTVTGVGASKNAIYDKINAMKLNTLIPADGNIDCNTQAITNVGNVDGVNVSALKTDVDGFNDELKDLTQVEIQQLENIGAELISAAEWGYVATLQDVASGASPTFDRITINDTGTVNSDAVRYDQLTSMVAGLNWQESILDNDLNTPPGGEGVGDRYIIAAVGAGAWTGHDDDIAEYNGVGWDFYTPAEGWTVWIVDEDTNFTWNGIAWVEFGSTISHNNTTGLQGGIATEYFHLSSVQHTEITGFFGATNITGGEAETLTDTSNADALHTHDLKLNIADIDDIPINAETAQPISSNWAFDHAANPVNINHLTDAQVAALHATYTDLEAVAAVEAAGLDFDTTKTLGFADDAVGVFVDRIYDEDDMASDDEHGLATQQSIKKHTTDRLYDIGFSHNWGGIVDKAPTVDKVYDQFIEVANEMTAIKYCLDFQGVWDATGGAAPNPAPGDGDYWIVSVAGVWDAVSWELLDWIVWEDNSEKWYKVKYFRQLPKVIVKGSDSIQTAIDKVIYMGGGIVEIQSGTFNDGNDAFPLNINDAGAGLFLKITGIGSSTIIDPNGDSTIFNITNIGKLILEEFKIDANDLTTAAKEIIVITEAGNNPITIRSIIIVGDDTNGIGIEINSDNCKVENCDISSINIGINILGNDNTIQGNAIASCNTYGIQLKGNNNSLYNNESDSNAVGIYLDTADYNQINGSYIEGNTLNGIYLTASNYNALSNNYCIGNDSNTANPQAGIYLNINSDYNTITNNTSINNNNAGAGTTYGIYISNANCDNNIVRGNTFSGNDIQWKDIGTNSDFEYRCSDSAEIQDAIDSIAAKSGLITILAGNITIGTTIDIDGGGAYIIEGGGDNTILTIDSDITCFNITQAKSLIFRNLKIDANALTTSTKGIIIASETNDNSVSIESINIVGDGTNGYGISITKDNVFVEKCDISAVKYGIHTTGDNGNFRSNTITTSIAAIYLSNSDNNIISENILDGNVNYGIYLAGTSSYNNISGNDCNDITVTAPAEGDAIGINIDDGCDYNIVIGNSCSNLTANNDDVVFDRWGFGIRFDSDVNNIMGNTCNNNTSTGLFAQGGGVFADENSIDNTINGNICNDNTRYGILVYNEKLSITSNTCNRNQYGIVISEGAYGSISNNMVKSNNYYGIYLYNSHNNVISSNVCTSNIQNGIHLHLSNENSITGNSCYGNGQNYGAATAGIYLDNSDNNNIVANTCNFAVNAGAGVGYGIYIKNDTCNVNQIANNTTKDNDYPIKDNGTNTIIEYYCTTAAEIQEAIDSIAAKSGIIKIATGTITLSATIDVDQSGDVTIIGAGRAATIIDCAGDRTAFALSATDRCVLKDLRIDASDVTTEAKPILDISSTNSFYIENLHIEGNNVTKKGHGIHCHNIGFNMKIVNCYIEYVHDGIFLEDHCASMEIRENEISYCGNHGIYGEYASNIHIHSNYIHHNTEYGIKLITGGAWNWYDRIINNKIEINAGGIYLDDARDCLIQANVINNHAANSVDDYANIYLNQNIERCVVANNNLIFGSNAGAGDFFGLIISNANCDDNHIVGNHISTNDTDYSDLGTGTILFGDDTVYGAGWNGDLGTATKNAIYDKVDAMDTLIGANTTTVEVEAIITAELVNGQSIDNRIDALLTANADNYVNAAEAHAYVEANALTITGGIQMNGVNITMAGAETVDGVDISAISITNMPTAINNWKMYCTNGAGIMTELATGAAATVLTGNGVGAAPSFQVAAGGDTDVSPGDLVDDHTVLGMTATLTAGENLVFGDFCYVKADGKYWKTDADTNATMPVVAMATDTIAQNAEGVFLTLGTARDDSWALTVTGGMNNIIYASTTLGGVQSAQPSGDGDEVQPLGYAITATIIYFNPQLWIARNETV